MTITAAEALKIAADHIAAWRVEADQLERDAQRARDRDSLTQFDGFGQAEALHRAADQLEKALGLPTPLDLSGVCDCGRPLKNAEGGSPWCDVCGDQSFRDDEPGF